MAVISSGLEAKYGVVNLATHEVLEDGKDCFVLRAQDVFGTQALFAYANAVQSLLEVHDVTQRGMLSSEECERLRILANNTHALAVEWSRRLSKKVPD